MLYELAHIIQFRFEFLWNAVEWMNSELFALVHRKGLKEIDSLMADLSTDKYTIRLTVKEDACGLVKFFEDQPEETFKFFRPHGFNEKNISRILRNKSFITLVVLEKDEIVGYFFLRSFINGKSFIGKFVDYRHRNQGIAKLMGVAMNKIAIRLGMTMFATISPENISSLASTTAVDDIKILKTLKNGYYYISCTPKN